VDDVRWKAIDLGIDITFFFDIVLNFFSAFFLENKDGTEELVHHRGKIAISYFKSWFFIDFVSIIPFSFMINTHAYT
jgi:hypothetical protein